MDVHYTSDDFRQKCIEGTRAYKRALVYAGHIKKGATFEDLDGAVSKLVDAKKKFDQLHSRLETEHAREMAEVMRERSRLRVLKHEVDSVPMIVRSAPKSPSELIIQAVVHKHGLSWEDIKGPRRQREYVRARQEYFYRMHKETDCSLPTIGRLCGNRDHTTVLHGIRQHEKRLAAEGV